MSRPAHDALLGAWECPCSECTGFRFGFHGRGEPVIGVEGDGAGMHPNFERPEPAETAFTDEHNALGDQYASGYDDGWKDADVKYDEAYDHGYSDAREDFKRRGPGFWAGFLLALAIAFVAIVFSPHNASGQASIAVSAPDGGRFQYGYVEDSARVELEQAWDMKDPTQPERGYCVEPSDVTVDTTSGGVEWHVHHISSPQARGIATPYAIQFHCAESAIGSLHIHTPTTCAREPGDGLGQHVKNCIIGGSDAYVCTVDEWDRFSARQQKDDFAIVQCDRHAFVFYWPNKRG